MDGRPGPGWLGVVCDWYLEGEGKEIMMLQP